MNTQVLPKDVICPQRGSDIRHTKASLAGRKAFNGKRWRTEMREAMAAHDWDSVLWLSKYHDAILSS